MTKIREKLAELHSVLEDENISPDSAEWLTASRELETIFGVIPVAELGLIARAISKEMSIEEEVIAYNLAHSGRPLSEFPGLPLKYQVALYVRWYRRQNHLTQASLAEQLAVTQPYIARIERANENLALDSAERLLATLGARLQLVC